MRINSKYPIKKLIKINFWTAIYFILLWLGISMAANGFGALEQIIRNSIFGTVLLLANSFLNMGILVFFEELSKTNKAKHIVYFLTSSYVLNIILYLIFAFIFMLIINADIAAIKLLIVGFISILVNTSSLVVQGLLLVHDTKTKIEIENSKLKAANSEAANQILRQQIQPHFLFNALSTLKSIYKKDTKAGETYLIRLSDFLRIVVSTNNTKVISLKEEIELSENYIEMRRIRFSESLKVSISISEDKLEKGLVPSFAIQSLLENAIKHNQLTEESPLYIAIQEERDRIKVSNNLSLKSSSTISSTGSGLSNLSERYKLISNDEIIIEQTENDFSVSIKIIMP